MSNVSVVVPLYNEEENVSVLQRELTEALGGLDYEIIFVDDGSRDETVSRIALDPRVRVLRFEKNAGLHDRSRSQGSRLVLAPAFS